MTPRQPPVPIRSGLLRLALLLTALAPPSLACQGAEPDGPKPGEAPPKLMIDTHGFTSRVEKLDFSPGGDVLAAAGEKVVRLWNSETGALLATLRGYDDETGNGLCNVVRYSPDGKTLLVGVQDFTAAGALRVYDAAATGELQALLPGHDSGGVADLAFSADGRYLASLGVDGGIIFWDWPARRKIGAASRKGTSLYFGFVPSAPILVSYDDDGFHAFSAPDALDAARLTPPQWAALGPAEVVGPAFAAAQRLGATLLGVERAFPFGGQATDKRVIPAGAGGGRVLYGIAGKADGRDRYAVGLWPLDGGPMIRRYDGHGFTPTALALRPDGAIAASADALGNVDLWETATGRRRLRLAGQGSTVYSVAFDSSGDKLAIGTRPFGPDQWGYNSYAAPERVFDLRKRTLLAAAPGSPATVPPPAAREAARQLGFTRDPATETAVFTSSEGGRRESFFALAPHVTPLCFGYLRGDRSGTANLLAIGCDDNSLAVRDPRELIRGRNFLGHTGAIYAVGESPDGRFLASGSADRTVRLWSLGRIDDMGGPDFDLYGDGLVTFLRPGGIAERAGVRVGDKLVRIGGIDLGTLYDRLLAGERVFRPGQRVEVEMSRQGQAYRATIDLIAAGDFKAPLLNLYVSGDEWVLWTPSGYYDASAGGDRLIGWHVNRGRARSAHFYTAHQFRKKFYRPDVIDGILQAGDAALGVATAFRGRPHAGPALDLRKPEDLRRVEPPAVTVREPKPGARTRGRSVRVRADVVSSNGQAIGAVKVLLNGRPITGRDLPRRPEDTDTTRHVDLDVALEPGPNTVSVLATDGPSKSSSRPQAIRVERDAPPEAADDEKPRVFLLAIGVSKFAAPVQDVKPLRFAHVDARTFAAAWQGQSGRLYESVKSRVLLNEQATVAGIREAFDWLQSSATEKDFAVLFVASHGIADPARGYYIAAHEVDKKRLLSTTIPDRDLIGLVEGLRCRRALVFLDVCHAGGIEGAKGGSAEGLNELTSDEVGAVMFGACLPRELSQEDPEWGHGAFTKAVLEVLGDPAQELPPADGLISTDEILYRIRRRVPVLTEDDQHPVVKLPGNVSDFNFYSYPTPVKPAAGDRPESSKEPGR